jgi:ABC-type lipoprotein release transport system permease subunit
LPASANRNAKTSHKLIGILAAKDLWHDWRTTGVLLCVVVSIVTPLLILLGLKQGVIDTQKQLLLNDPCNLQIKIEGNGYNLPPEWFEKKTKDPRIQFIIPVTRFLSRDIGVLDEQNNVESVNLIATAVGDPLLKLAGLEAPTDDRDVLITHALAKRLHLQRNKELHTQLSRTVNNELQQSKIPLNIKAVLPEYGCLQSSAILATLNLLLAVKEYREGLDVPLFQTKEGRAESLTTGAGETIEKQVTAMPSRGLASEQPLSCQKEILPNSSDIEAFQSPFEINHEQTPIDGIGWQSDGDVTKSADAPKPKLPIRNTASYETARIFAKTLDDVPILADELRSGNNRMEINSNAYEIKKLKQLDRFLNILFLIVSLIGMVGGGFALGGNFLLSIDGKRLQIAQMRLLGLSKPDIGLFLGIQGVLITSCAFIAIIILSLISQFVAELYGKEILGAVIETGITEIRIFHLSLLDYMLVYLITLMFTGLVIVIATKQANKIHPGEQLREL